MSALPFVAFLETVLCITLTAAQRVLCLVTFDGVQPADLAGDQRDIARQLFGDVDTVPAQARHVLVAMCGARGGKSWLLVALYSLWRALTADLSGLAPGEQATALIVAPDLRLARQALRYCIGAARLVPSIAALIASETADALVLRRPDGRAVAIEVLPATRGGSAVRGRTLVSACLDESCFFHDERYAVNDLDIFRAVSPRVLPDGMVVLASTPWTRSGLLFDEFTANHGAPRTALAAHAATTLLRPEMAELVERERIRDPRNAAREFDGIPGDATRLGFLGDRSAIDACREPGRILRPFVPGITYTIACDVSLGEGAGHDAYGVAVATSEVGAWDHDTGTRIPPRLTRIEMCEAWAADAPPSVMARRLFDRVCRHFHQATVHLDQAGGLAIVEIFRDAGIRPKVVHWTGGSGEGSKLQRYSAVRAAIRERSLLLPDDPKLVDRFARVQSELLPSGIERVVLPRTRGDHLDDISAAVMAASVAIEHRPELAPQRETHLEELWREQREQSFRDFFASFS